MERDPKSSFDRRAAPGRLPKEPRCPFRACASESSSRRFIRCTRTRRRRSRATCELVEHLDQLGYDEAWIGEHHSAGYEIIASPEIFIAAAAERTKHIRLGTGVVVAALPPPADAGGPHHAARSHDARARDVRHGAGRAAVRRVHDGHPGAGAARPHGRGDRRDRAAAARRDRDAQVRLVRAARCQASARALQPSARRDRASPRRCRRLARARRASTGSGCSRSGRPRRAASTCSPPTGRSPKTRRASTARRCSAIAWRLVGPMHIAETREKARENVRFGLADWLRYFQEIAALPLVPPGNVDDAGRRAARVGLRRDRHPDDAIAQLERLAAQSGGFGCFLQMAHELGRLRRPRSAATSCSRAT